MACSVGESSPFGPELCDWSSDGPLPPRPPEASLLLFFCGVESTAGLTRDIGASAGEAATPLCVCSESPADPVVS